MTVLPNIPRLYTALAECLAVGIYALPLGIRFGKTATLAASAAWALALSAFLQATGSVPLAWWIPCMAAAVGIQYLYLWVTRTISLLEAGYVCARAFVLAELAASAEWQLHCFLWPQRNGADGLSLLLLVVVYGGVFGCIWVLEHKHTSPKGHIVISGKAALVVVVMAAMVFAVSNLLFLGDREVDMSVYYIRTLVDICGVLILTVQHEQLREAALHSELAAMDEVLHRQYEQYKRSKEGIRLINSRYHALKIQIADIRAERDRAKQDAALARMESGLRQYEAENKTGNPVLDTLLTAKSMDCQQRGINMTSVADGSQLGFLSTRELCTLVGAPLDKRHRERAGRARPRKASAAGGHLQPERLRDAPLRELLRPARGAGRGRSARPQRPRRLRPAGRAGGRPAPRRHHDPSLGRRLVHPADPAAGPIVRNVSVIAQR